MGYTPFRPVRCTEAQLAGMAKIDGYIYFTLDTGRIYIDKGTERRLVGGGKGASVYYASSSDIEQNEQKYYIITPDMLEDPAVDLAEGDIIINIDGSFYKVFEINKLTNEIWCDRIAVSGSGGGGGDTSFAKKINVKISSPSTTNLINGQSFSVEVSATSAVSADGEIQDEKLQLFWELSEKNSSGDFIVYHKKTVDIGNNVTTTLEIGTLMRENSTVRFSVYAKGVNSGESTVKYIDFTTSNLSLEPAENFSNLNLFDSTNIVVQCNVVGNTDKLLYIYWDGTLLEDMPKQISASANTLQTQSIPASKATHGRHTVHIELYQNVNNSNGLKAGELSYEVAIKETNDTTPIIWCNGYKSSYYDYEIIQIPFQVYDPMKSTAEVILYKNNKEIGTRQITRNEINPSFEIWEIVDADVDSTNSYAIACGEDERYDRYDISFEVTETDKLKLAFPEALVLKFDATGRSNNESATNREIWSNPIDKYSSYKGSFTDFNWYNNGWMTDEDNKTHLRISNGAKFDINFDPMIFSTGVEGKNSWTVEMQFKVSNLKNYQSLITNYTRYPNDGKYWEAFRAQMTDPNGYTNYDAYLRSILGDATDEFCKNIDRVEKVINTSAAICKFYANDIGFCLGPQDAFFTTKNDTVNVSYVEDKMINIAIVFSYSNQFISIYLNGVLSGIAKSTIGGSFIIDSNMIEFNSDYCDINLYKFRIYNTNLAINYIDLNLAADKKDIDLYDQTNLALYNSNLNEYQFSYNNMLDYNKKHPDNALMPYVVWTTHGKTEDDNKLPYSKQNEIRASMEFHNVALDRAYVTGQLNDLAAKDGLTDEECQRLYGMTAVQYYYLHHCPSWHGDNISMKVQGTSSEFYPRRNYKCKTKTAGSNGKKVVNMYMNEGPFEGTETQTKWFYFDNYTVGTTKFTMKIDFMESSGTYNVGFANLVNNAYNKHPLDDYNKAGAFQVLDPDSTIEEEATEYSEGTVYTYYNHKGNPKQTNDPNEPDNIKLTSKEDFDLGPYALYQKLMQKDPTTYSKLKVLEDTTSPRYNKWYIMVPGYKTYSIPDTQNYRTSVQGFPVLAFHKREDTGEIKYIGRYNMILDKGADEAYGFAIDNVYQKFAGNKELPKVAECWEFSDNIGTFCSFRDPSNQDALTFKQTLSNGKENLTENDAPIVANSFEYRYHNDADDIDIVYNLKNASTDDLNTLAKNQGLTDLSSDNKEPARAWLLDKMKHWEKACAWVWSTCTDVVPTEAEIATAIKSSDWSAIEKKYGKTQDKIVFETPKIYGNREYQYDSQESRLAKFQAELADHFDIDYTATYFVMTEVFECYDSRGKNAMMASWGPLKEGGDYIWYPIFYDIDTQLGINNTGIPSFTFDIDATKDGCFSTNNSVLWTNFYKCYQNSYIRQKYRQLRGYTDESINVNIFGPKLTPPPLDTVARIERWYLTDSDECGRGLTRSSSEKHPFLAMKGQRPLIALNLDEYYKYITITNNNISAGGGYLGQNGEWIADNSNGKPTGSYFYALQGDRSLSRQQFLTDRLNYINSWLKCGEFQRGEGSGQVWGRISANIPSEFPDLWIADESQVGKTEGENLQYSPYWTDETETIKTNEFDAEYWVTLTPARSTYLTIGLDNNALGDNAAEGSEDTEDVSLKYKGSPVKITFPVDVAEKIKTQPKKHQQLLYLYAASQMTDLGDLSKLYWSEFHMTNDCKKLTRLLLGNDNFDCLDNDRATRGYYRTGAQPLALKSMPLLQEMCLSGIRTSDPNGVTYDLSYSEKLKSFRALRTNITNMTFAKGVALETLYLPDCTASLKLTEARQLTKLLTEYPVTKGEKVGEYNCQKGLYIEKLFDTDPSTSINNVTLIGDKLGYDSFILINQICSFNKNCQITIEGVDWCPYKLIDSGTVYNVDEKDLYFKDNKHYGFEPYEYTTLAAWNLSIANGELYKLNKEILNSKSDKLISCELLEKMATSKNYTSATEDSEIPTLKGIVFIKNTDAIEEDYIHNDLQIKYPDLQFFFETVNKAYSAEFIQQEDNGTYQVLASQRINPNNITNSWFINPYTNYKEPKKLDYDFIGWATDPEGKNMLGTKSDGSDAYSMTDEEWLASKAKVFNAETFDYTFYAIFVLHKYQVRFLDGDDTDLVEPLAIAYGEKVGSLVPTKIPHLNDSELPQDQTYSFIGYKTSKSSSKVIDIEKYVIRNDTVFYPSFEAINVYDNIHPEYFYKASSLENGISLGLKVEMQGKITIPAKFNGEIVRRLNPSFASSVNKTLTSVTPHGQYLTHVFFEKGSQVDTFEVQCFSNENANDDACLEYVELPDSLRTIKDYCFYRQYGLKSSMLTQLSKSGVTRIGAYAFQQTFGKNRNYDSVSEVQIRGIVSEIGEHAFYNMGVKFDTFIIGSKGELSQWTPSSKVIVAVGRTNVPYNVKIYSTSISQDQVASSFTGASTIEIVNV